MLTEATVVVFLGPPGSGKGTQSSRLAAALGIPAISTGEMLRKECQSGSKLGREVQTVLASGQLVSDDLINRVVARRLARHDCKAGCILDGYPRTVSQARYLSDLLDRLNMPQPTIFAFDIDCDEVVSRLARRRHCPECGRIFSIDSANGTDAVCTNDNVRLIRRADDNPASIRERLWLYQRNAQELVRYYRGGNYHRICATHSPDAIAGELLELVGQDLPVCWAIPDAAAALA